jgi:hypothetical protein
MSRPLNSGYEYLRFPVDVVCDESQYVVCVSQKGVRARISVNTRYDVRGSFNILVLVSMEAFPEIVKVPPSAGPLETHTPGLTAAQRESIRSTLQ